MKQTSYLSLFVIGVLLVGGITPTTLAFADEDKVKLEIEREDGITKIEIETSDLDVELKLEAADSEEIIDTIQSYVELPDEVIEKLSQLDDSDFEFEYEYETDSESDEETNEKKINVCHKGTTIHISKNALDAHLRHGDTEGPCTALFDIDVEDETDEDTDTETDDESEGSEAREAIHDAIEEIEDATLRLQHASDAGINVTDAEELIVKAKLLVNEAEAAFELGEFMQAEDLADDAEDLAKEARFLLGDEFDDVEEHEDQNNADSTPLEQRIHALETENQELRDQIVDLEEQIENLNLLLREQLRVIYEWILNR